MTKRYRKTNPLTEIIRSQDEEIQKYKWIESEKAGRDIGWERAATEWLNNHFPDWKRSNWDRAVREALESEAGSKN